MHVPGALGEFFEEYGVPVSRAGETPDVMDPRDFDAMAATLQRNGVNVIAPPGRVR